LGTYPGAEKPIRSASYRIYAVGVVFAGDDRAVPGRVSIKLHIPDNNFGRCYMENQQGVSIAEQPREESTMKRYLRFTFIAVSIILFLAIIVGAIVRKLG
jgi:hypothetical protein